jgi:hypothetical protein
MVEKMEELIFNAAIGNIKFIKAQEWVLTSSALTFFGALTAGQKHLAIGPLAPEVRYISIGVIAAMTVFSWHLFSTMAESLDLSRDDVDKIQRTKSKRTCFDRCGIFYCLKAIVIGGAIASSYAIFFA